MAYTGLINDENYARKNKNETITGQWTFNQKIKGWATETDWGDLAEKYEGDTRDVYLPGTLTKFGGDSEITKTEPHDRNFFGVVSTKPGVLMNADSSGEKIALVGKVPVRVIGKVKKFDKLTTSRNFGVASKKRLFDYLLFRPTIGVALQNKETKEESLVYCSVHSKI